MDRTILYILALLLLGILTYLRRRERVVVGKVGEWAVSKSLKQLDNYTVIDDLLLPSDGNTTNTQIDHVLVSKFGIFCIETKTYKGWIFGNANEKQWTHVNFKRKDKFYNPLYQNFAHTKALKSLLGEQRLKAPIVPLVIFRAAGKIQVTGTDNVGNTLEVINKIKSFSTPIYSDEEVADIVRLVSSANITDSVKRKAHNKQVASKL